MHLFIRLVVSLLHCVGGCAGLFSLLSSGYVNRLSMLAVAADGVFCLDSASFSIYTYVKCWYSAKQDCNLTKQLSPWEVENKAWVLHLSLI